MKKETDLAEKLASAPPAEWVIEMRRHYARTGSYRPEDLRRLLGDQSKVSDLAARLAALGKNSSFRQF